MEDQYYNFKHVIDDFKVTSRHIIGSSAIYATCSIYQCGANIKPGDYLRRCWTPFPWADDEINNGYWENICYECDKYTFTYKNSMMNEALLKWDRLKKLEKLDE